MLVCQGVSHFIQLSFIIADSCWLSRELIEEQLQKTSKNRKPSEWHNSSHLAATQHQFSMKSHEITLSLYNHEPAIQPPPRSKHPSKWPCESQSTGPTRQNLSDWRYASIKDWKVAWKIQVFKKNDEKMVAEELTDQGIIFTKQRWSAFAVLKGGDKKRKGKTSEIDFLLKTLDILHPNFEAIEAPRPRHQSSPQGSAKQVGLQPSSFAQKWKDWAWPRCWRSLAYRDWEWIWDVCLLKPTC